MHVPFGTVYVAVVCPLLLPAPAEFCYFLLFSPLPGFCRESRSENKNVEKQTMKKNAEKKTLTEKAKERRKKSTTTPLIDRVGYY